MNKTHKTLLLIAVLLTITFSACKDDEEATFPEVPIVDFTFTSPESGKMFGRGDTVYINGMISWENELHGYELTITNMSADSVVYTSHSHEDIKMIHIHKMWVNNLMHHSDMKLTIDAITDHVGAKETKEIMFHCHPM
jgi:hypothetical protein